MGRLPTRGVLRGHPQLPACSCRRVDFVAKYLGGLREQEKRIKHLESQASEPRSSSP